MIEEIVRRLIGVEDAPKWLEREVFSRVSESVSVEDAVNYLAPWLYKVYRFNINKYRPGHSSIRKASLFLVAELLEQLGYDVVFVQLFGTTLPAVASSYGNTPILPLFDTKRKSLYLAAKAKKLGVMIVTTTRQLEGILVDVIKSDRPPYYYLYTSANLRKFIERAPSITSAADRKYHTLYYYWRHFRQRGYLVLVGREIGGVGVDIFAVGLGRYAVVSQNSGRITRLKKLVDAVYLI